MSGICKRCLHDWPRSSYVSFTNQLDSLDALHGFCIMPWNQFLKTRLLVLQCQLYSMPAFPWHAQRDCYCHAVIQIKDFEWQVTSLHLGEDTRSSTARSVASVCRTEKLLRNSGQARLWAGAKWWFACAAQERRCLLRWWAAALGISKEMQAVAGRDQSWRQRRVWSPSATAFTSAL